ncbi:MAG: site-specific DNA-methyltransferase, partial [Patescibacteria group bacterium]
NDDCLNVLKDLPDKCVDLVLTDPPYGVNLGYDIYKDTEDAWFELMAKFIPEARRVAKMVIMPSCQIKRLEWIYKNHAPDWLICWYKGSVGSAGYVGFNDWEPHLVYGKINTQMHDYFKATPEPQTNGHPCQKPLSWANWLISRATEDGMTVLDPFMGSGTTCVSAKQLGRKYIGIEMSPAYIEIARQRLRQDVFL